MLNNNRSNSIKRIRKAVIPAAGIGTSFLPVTKACPKEMLPIVDKPTIQYIVEEALASGITDVLIITGRTKRAIEDHFDRAPELEESLSEHGKEELLKMIKDIGNINIHFIRQKEPKGLGHAILCAKRFIDYEPFAVMLGDDVVYNDKYPCLKQLIDVYNTCGGSVLGCQTVPLEKVSAYCIMSNIPTDNERIYKVKDMVEKPKVGDAPSRLAVLGRYVITPDIFRILDNTHTRKGGEIQLTDSLKILARQQDVYAYEFFGRRYDVGDKEGYLEAQVEYALRREDLDVKFKEYLKKLLNSDLHI